MPSDRVLTVFAFDPTQARRFGNVAHVQLPFEELTPGPVGRRLEVIDYDASNRCYYRAVDLDDPEILRQGGLAPSESNPQFHQQMAYAVAQQTIHTFQLALGRPIRWAFWRQPKGGGERLRLRIHPHAMAEAIQRIWPNSLLAAKCLSQCIGCAFIVISENWMLSFSVMVRPGRCS